MYNRGDVIQGQISKMVFVLLKPFPNGEWEAYDHTNDKFTLTGATYGLYTVIGSAQVGERLRDACERCLRNTEAVGSLEGLGSACFHSWKEYVGFTSRFQYCTMCDKKKYE